MSGLESAPIPVELTVPMPADQGPGSSVSFIAEVTGYPAYPFLISLNDGQNELVKLEPAGAGGCGKPGLFCCGTRSCAPNERWVISQPSMFASREHWEQHQLSDFGTLSVNRFPTCDWSRGEPECMIADARLFPGGKLRGGTPYRLKYALIADESLQTPQAAANLKVTVLKKRQSAAGRGRLDLNFILVGQKNVAASRTRKGQRNLDALLDQVAASYAGSGISLGEVRAVEWDCGEGGDAYADIELTELPRLFSVGSARLPADGEGRSVNLFMVSSLRGEEPGQGFTFLGVSGGILGPMVNGTAASGLAFSSFNKLDIFNPLCGEEECPPAAQQRDFHEIGITIAHETGHFLGLNHPSESSGRRHDFIPDTPICTQTQNLSIGRYITVRSCWESDSACRAACPGYDGRSSFCPERTECQFNHLMWWTSKNFVAGEGDGNLISADSTAVLHLNPLVR
ncbi:MAG: hypothetical protein NDJ90_04160 [Oligoflexia bacterium]|nr:hypothetical protein [Oligoflexia bacterium]